jgi:hypothetical protein
LAIVLVSGAIANKLHQGGEAWVRLSWALGLKKLGFRVHFVEAIAREKCADARGAAADFDACENRAYFRRVAEQFGLERSATLVEEGGERTSGLSWAELLELADAAELLVNISGHLAVEPLLRRVRRKAYIDIDPGFTQYWHAEGLAGARLSGHDFFFTIGENVGTSGCPIPTAGIPWRPTRQPVVLDDWPIARAGDPDRFTTVANWRSSFGPVRHGARTFGLKVHEFRKFIDLPARARAQFEIALNIHPADDRDLKSLQAHGWAIIDAFAAASDPSAFRRFVQSSGAEFSAAQGIYVDTQSGWFSDRTVRYLASGKPVLVQDTGFGRHLPVGEGLLSFRTLEEAVAGVARIMDDYEHHCRAARAIAEEFFDANRILRRLIEDVGIAP